MIIPRTLVLVGLIALGPTSYAQVTDIQHFMVYHEAGRFGGWPANFGIWRWGNEILVGYARGYYKDLGPERHNIDRNRPEQHWLARSLDGGQTWTHEHPMDKGQIIPYGDALHGTETPGLPIPPLQDCPGGIDFSHPDFALTARMVSVHAGESRFYYSYDRGHEWAGPFRLPNFGTRGTAARTDYIVDGKHEMTMMLTAAKADGNEGRTMAIRTNDGGATWQKIGWVDEEPSGFAIMPATVRLGKNELFTIVRRRELTRRWNAAYRSLDNGQTWSRQVDPIDSLGEGNPPALIQLQDGRLCYAYGYRAEPYSICVKFSSDRGQTWGLQHLLRSDGGNRDIGYPRMVQRPDGKVVVIYYFNDLKTGPERYIAVTVFDPGK